MTRSPATPLPPPKARRRLRETAALTQTQLADRVGVTPGTVRAWESGRTTPRGRKREAYAKLLKTLAEEGAVRAPEPEPKLEPESRPQPQPEAKPQPEPQPQPEPEPKVEPEGKPQPQPDSQPQPQPVAAPEPVALTPAQAFDALYAFSAPALVRQTFLLTGRREQARESVERAFQAAWEHWPEVARDRDPVGWVRATAYEYALSPWQRLRPRHRHPEPPPADPGDRTLLNALLRLPPRHRRTLVLYDGVGLDLPETAAETEASTPATANRLLRAREAVAGRLPALADPQVLHRRLAELASNERLRAAEPPTVRRGGERRARLRTRAAIAFTVALVATTALTVRTAPTHYEPPVSPGQAVRGVPQRVAPGALSDEELELRQKLRDQMQDGPERLSPRLE
ncbi:MULTISPECIES: helix-turn-helix domain-containing protein [Streptomyces]|uniref:Helix-turn-helix domain-containing protein n=1 Tax=Streptomyces tendae TaxID=1932 RepID=A0ABW7RR17_STRTE|nr:MULTISPECIES: helix-turn-helix domain-containing protein [unclassified Streptomyces]MBQ0965177.1 helix-turn-helix domain-containing protein [Streptomyces sp. RK74B]MBQ1005015.1 helix-turn-helix domain-containing protein [Streptomyces sp. RK23]